MFVSEKISVSDLIERYKTPNGIYILEGISANAGVLPYNIEENGETVPSGIFTAPYTLFESAYSLVGVPVVLEHKEDFNADIEQMEGIVLDAYPYSDFELAVRIAIWGDKLLEYIRDGNYELSAGYEAQVIKTDGNWFGSPYGYEKRDLVYNHLAIVKKGTARNGASAKLLIDSTTIKSSLTIFCDNADTVIKLDSFNDIAPMTKYINIPNHKAQFQVAEEVADYIESLTATVNDTKSQISDSAKINTSLTETKTLLESTLQELTDSKEKVATLRKEVEETKNKLPSYMKIANKAQKLGVSVDFENFDPTAVMRSAIESKYPDVEKISQDTLEYLFNIAQEETKVEPENTETTTTQVTDSKRPIKTQTSLKATVNSVKTETPKPAVSSYELADSIANQRKTKKGKVVTNIK